MQNACNLQIRYAPVSKTQREIENAFAGSLLALPLIPSFFALLIAVATSVILNLVDTRFEIVNLKSIFTK